MRYINSPTGQQWRTHRTYTLLLWRMGSRASEMSAALTLPHPSDACSETPTLLNYCLRSLLGFRLPLASHKPKMALWQLKGTLLNVMDFKVKLLSSAVV